MQIHLRSRSVVVNETDLHVHLIIVYHCFFVFLKKINDIVKTKKNKKNVLPPFFSSSLFPHVFRPPRPIPPMVALGAGLGLKSPV